MLIDLIAAFVLSASPADTGFAQDTAIAEATIHDDSPDATATESPSFSGIITEDDPRWDCRTMGNLICGPANAQGVVAGQYSPDGLIIPWPAATVPEWCGDICRGA